MFTYVGQDAPNAPTFQVDPNGQPAAAQALFLADLDPETVSFYGFEDLTPDNTDATPARSVNNTGSITTTARFDAYDASGEIPALVIGRNEAVVRLQANTNQIGTFATSGSQYLVATAYDGSNAEITDASAGTTQLALRLSYDAPNVTAGRTPKAFSSFGAYITDTEGYGTIRLALTPLGGGTQVIVDFNGILNQGITTTGRGNGQLTFIGFTDFDSQYQTIDISFTNRKTPPAGGTTVTNEAFGFDDFVVGELNQVFGPDEVASTDRVLNLVDEPGWRLLSAPVRGVTVGDLAQQNLVQGVLAGDGDDQAQYPEGGSNFYWEYKGGTRFDYIPVPTTGTILRPGRAFWWYWYDLDLSPDPTGAGGGTSVSVELDDFQLAATGAPLLGAFTESFPDNTDCSSDLEIPCPTGTRNQPPPPSTQTPNGPVDARDPNTPADDDFYMVGNPFPSPYGVASISASGGTLQDAMYMWNPSNQGGTTPRTGDDQEFDGPGSYEVVFQTPPVGPADFIAVWQGMLVEVSKAPAEIGDDVVFTFNPAGIDAGQAPPFHGFTAAQQTGPERYIQFGMSGTMASGAKTRDAATYIRFRNDATDDWDRYDSSKPSSPVDGAALSAVGKRDGQEYYHGVLSLDANHPVSDRWAQAIVRLAFATSEAGTYTLNWDGNHGPVKLRDLEAGVVIRLDQEETYTFEAEAGDWDKRFMLVFGPQETTESVSGATALSTVEAATVIGTPSPNPTTDAFALDVRTAGAAETTVSVYDALGRRVVEQTISGTEAQSGTSVIIPTANLAPGAYIVVVDAPDVRETRRVTVLR